MGVRCFFLEPIEPPRERRWLRRYSSASPSQCPLMPGDHGFHNAKLLLGDFDRIADEAKETPPHEDPRWNMKCGCGYAFIDADPRQLFTSRLFRRSDNSEVTTLDEAPAGAMWFAPWFSDAPEYRGPDGHTLIVRCPDGHDWIVDGRASNCTMPQDNVHKCWVRHGTPPDITVDKNGNTCKAGAGSIQTRKWHGFLRNGELVKA